MHTTPPAARGPWVLVLDAGSSSVRAQWRDADGEPFAPPEREAYAWTVTPDGGMTVDADALVDLCLRVIDRAVVAGRVAGLAPAGVAAATLWHGLAGIGADGRATTPLFGWGDGRARAVADGLRSRLDAEAVHARTGCFLHELYPAARLLWLRGATGDTLPPAAAWGGLGELLAARLFGHARTSLSAASGTGLLDVHGGAWDAEMLAAVGIGADRLPPVSDEAMRGLRPEFAARWPELAAVPWFPAWGDGACASLGMGAAGRRAGLTIGTSAAVRVLRKDARAVVPPGLWCYRVDARRTVCGRAISNGGNVFAWLRRTLALPSAGELEARLAAMPPAAHGLAVRPRLVPERPPPDLAPDTASIAGMTAATGAVEIARAWLEAVAYALADGLDAVESAFGPVDQVVAGGGALHASPAWTRIVADALGRPFRLAAQAGEETLRGAALLALERLGIIPDALGAAVADSDGLLLAPDPAAHATYRSARGR